MEILSSYCVDFGVWFLSNKCPQKSRTLSFGILPASSSYWPDICTFQDNLINHAGIVIQPPRKTEIKWEMLKCIHVLQVSEENLHFLQSGLTSFVRLEVMLSCLQFSEKPLWFPFVGDKYPYLVCNLLDNTPVRFCTSLLCSRLTCPNNSVHCTAYFVVGEGGGGGGSKIWRPPILRTSRTAWWKSLCLRPRQIDINGPKYQRASWS